jgi:hypothetical protein
MQEKEKTGQRRQLHAVLRRGENKSWQYVHERRHIPAGMNFATRHKQRASETKNLNTNKKNNDKTREYERRRWNEEVTEWD